MKAQRAVLQPATASGSGIWAPLKRLEVGVSKVGYETARDGWLVVVVIVY